MLPARCSRIVPECAYRRVVIAVCLFGSSGRFALGLIIFPPSIAIRNLFGAQLRFATHLMARSKGLGPGVC